MKKVTTLSPLFEAFAPAENTPVDFSFHKILKCNGSSIILSGVLLCFRRVFLVFADQRV